MLVYESREVDQLLGVKLNLVELDCMVFSDTVSIVVQRVCRVLRVVQPVEGDISYPKNCN